MEFIKESVIEDVISSFEQEEIYLGAFKNMLENQPGIRNYIEQESLELLTADEMTLLEYLTTVIYTATFKQCGILKIIEPEILESKEDENWAIFNNATNKSFQKILDLFFDMYPQEDLLALVEDSIQMDENSIVTSVGAEIILISCKTLIDVLHQSN